MAGRFPRSFGFVPRRDSLRAGLATALLLAGAGTVHDASAVGDTRTLSFHHTHSGENLTVTFKQSGRYDSDSLKKLNHFLRDWRSQDSTTMDPHLFDILWEVYRDVDAKQPIQIISAYRSPSTNAMLRRRSSGVARSSQHMLGHAMDFFIPGVPLERIRFAGLRLQRGGVGFYPTSGSPFVHLDTGRVRHWPRMTHDQLARVFPNGRTVHVPSDGKPLPGYEIAMAEIERRKSGETTAGSGKPTFLASLFSRKQQPAAVEDDDEGNAPAANTAKPGVIARAAETIKDKAETIRERIAEAVPLPRAKPRSLEAKATATYQTASYQVASALPQDVTPPPSAKRQATSAKQPLTPADIINTRAFWDDSIAMPKQASPEQIAALRARTAVTEADPQSTASLPREVAQALAYAPPHEQRAQVVAARAPMPMTPRQRLAATHAAVETVVAKSRSGQPSAIATMAQVTAASQMNHTWMRAMMMTPNVTTSLSSTIWGDRDMTELAVHFIKPDRAVAMTFNGDPQMGIVCGQFTGSAMATLSTTTFLQRTASLR
ncbi:ATP-binding protein [Afipia sp. Root123D2]|uniref:DUF882 domain-containing protein n=1 Tax=Afipia sp. Root123D2 TaxID=1736436 RepID=UPI0006F40187|nr:DUF882 domain-containing protein [Afipia sp. Root123D2]KQW21900.1 ATP-binding protein [Afipia sp. Root123D2]